MPIKLTNNIKITILDQIVSGTVDFNKLGKDQKDAIINLSVANNDFRALYKITNEVTGIYDYDEHKPYWLDNFFHDDVWKIKLLKNDKLLLWNEIVLDDGEKLTTPKHRPLLNAFKYWIVSLDNPLENGGKLLKKTTVIESLNRVIALINVILINSKAISLSKRSLGAINNDFVIDALTRYASKSSISEGFYCYQHRLTDFLKEKISDIKITKVQSFIKSYPYASRSLLPEEKKLSLTQEERIKACYWLYTNGFYKIRRNIRALSPNSRMLAEILYSEKVIGFGNVRLPNIEDLNLTSPKRATEHIPIPVADVSKVITDKNIESFISSFKMLSVVHFRANTAPLPLDTFHNINSSRIQKHASIRETGRYRTLPAELILKSIQNAFEFCFENMNEILSTIIKVLLNAPKPDKFTSGKYKTHFHKGKYKSSLSIWKEDKLSMYVHPRLINLGVKYLSISNNIPDRFQDRRENKGLLDLYDILIGSIQLLTGALMARRIDELIKLEPVGNIFPKTDPTSPIGQKTNYSLIFKLKKSGFGGEHGKNHTEMRPIPHSLAKFIYKLELFNTNIVDLGIQINGRLSLFNSIDAKNLSILKIDNSRFNRHLDSFCDYFQTSCILKENREIHRYYIRQHQLRRFFAIVFFWSKSFDGLETLRWMLGHTDIEHLYHYVTESQTGDVLNGVKASYLVDQLTAGHLENIADLKQALAQRYGVYASQLSISTISEAITDFQDEDEYQTIPSIASLRKREEVELQVLELIEEDIVILEPEFFTVEGPDGTRQDYNLILKVKEVK